MTNVPKKPKTIRIAQALFVLNAAIWLTFGIVTLARMAGKSSGMAVTMVVIGVMMFGNAAAMLVNAVGLGTRWKLVYFFALAVLTVNIILTFTDQVGFFDVATVTIDLILLGLLIATRAMFTTTPQ